MRNTLLAILLFLFQIAIYAQDGVMVQGTVTDSAGQPLPGASVVVQGTTTGTQTDFDGNFTLDNVPSDGILSISYLGFVTQEIGIDGSSTISIALSEDAQALDEVVVVGYGTQKKSDLTSSIVSVDTESMEKVPTGQLMQAVQGKAAGVQISSQGSPGESPEIIIRGVNSVYGDSNPLFVVDGVFFDSIDFLNASEIESLSILKDASAAAIYGVEASNGVILITTKGGKFNRNASISYTGYTGVQTAQNVLQMANSEQFVNFALESGSDSEIASVNSAMQRFGRSRINPNVPNVNTDWYDEVLRKAMTQNHDISINGGSENIAYSVGGNFFYQDGILDMNNSYERFNLRTKLDIKANDWLKVGGSIVYSNATKFDDEASAWQLAYFAVPILPVYDYLYTEADPLPYSDAKEIGYRGSQNPFPLMDNSDLKSNIRRTVANFYADFQLIPEQLNFKTSLSYNHAGTTGRSVKLPYYVTDDYQRSVDESSITRSQVTNESYVLDNVLTYQNTFDDHDLTLMGGMSYRDNYGSYFGTTGYFDPSGAFVRDKEQTWYIKNTSTDSQTSTDSNDTYPYRNYGFSYFGRAAYKFKDRYLAYATYRAEGTNKYDETYVYLPAFGLGWVLSEESFMKDVSFIDYFKLRGGWGRLANGSVPASDGGVGSSTVQTVFNDQYYTGTQFETISDNISWEFTEETNIGISAKFLDSRLSLEADYFIKDTKDMVIPLSPLVGTEVSYQNVGSVRNKGIELAIGYNGKIGKDFGYSINANFSKLENEVTDLYTQPYIERGSAEFRQMIIKGQPIDVFYGYDIEGVYQTQAEIDSDPVAQSAIAGGTNISPGYFKYKDVDGSGELDADDRVYLGAPVPDYFYGGSINLNYKNWDFSTSFYGQGGNVILNRNRAEVIWTTGRNVDAELAKNRWTGEGSTNAFPSSEGYRQSWNQKLSNFFLQEGDFFRIQNIQLAYTLKNDKLPEIRFSLTADRPFLWTKGYNGFNPEVGFDGIDSQTYPIPSTYTFGMSIKI
ncbi:SusC/RagA family TonB-linked outer membrane protein [Maribacter polysiphoniae]|uniref:SusC/RagA family TonB-linked outer membrane protein n=1 Tax=Maribacter polysiphoniae TaxID=429344 RepID=UPI0023575DD9|nr:TonB-dependent receptor [Maribacter polysiphoniae]